MSWRAVAITAAAVLVVPACSGDPELVDTPQTSRAASGEHHGVEPLQPRAVHHATALSDGRVLVTGGCTEPGCGGFDAARASELFDPVTMRFAAGATMVASRASGTATLLRDGRVLLTGGYPGEGMPPTSSAEVFDPEADRFSRLQPMTTPRANHTATLLADGRVLLCGGQDDRQALATTEIFDPRTGTFTEGPRLSAPRAAHSTAVVGDRVVLVGGAVRGSALATTDVLVDGAWTPGPTLRTPRVKHAAAALPGHRVLVVGGSSTTEGPELLATTELVDIAHHRVTPGPHLSEGQYKLDGAVATLGDGRIVIAGGQRVNVYDPATNSIAVLQEPLLQRLSFVTATAIGSRKVLVAGGYDDAIVPTDRAVVVTVTR